MKYLVEVLQIIQSWYLSRNGYKGVIRSQRGRVALIGENPFQQFPGLHQTLGGNSAAQRDIDVQYNVVTKNIFPSKANVRQTTNSAPNDVLPASFRRTAGGNVGPRVYTAMDQLQDILAELKRS